MWIWKYIDDRQILCLWCLYTSNWFFFKLTVVKIIVIHIQCITNFVENKWNWNKNKYLRKNKINKTLDSMKHMTSRSFTQTILYTSVSKIDLYKILKYFRNYYI